MKSPDPVLHLVAGPNGAGKSTLVSRVIAPVTHLPCVTETVFSHESKLDLVLDAIQRGYNVTLYVVIVPEDLAVARVADRVARGGHSVPEDKTRERYRRLWPLVAEAALVATRTRVYDNSTAANALLEVARLEHGALVSAQWPLWTPAELVALP